VKLLLGHRASPARSREQLRTFRDAAAARRDELDALVPRLRANPDAVYGWATALFGLRFAEAIVGWADEVIAALPDRAISVDPRRREPTRARALLDEIARRR